MERKEEDIKYGQENEEGIIKTLETFFNTVMIKTEPFHPMDFQDKAGNYYELKSRRVNHNTYPSTMVGYNKIKFCKKNKDVKHFFIFKFIDGIYYYLYSPDDLLMSGIGGRSDRGKEELKYYFYISNKYLKPLKI